MQFGALVVGLLMAGGVPANAEPARVQASEVLHRLPLHFEPNRGQFDPRVKFLSRVRGYAFYVGEDEAVIDARRADGGCVVKMRLAGSSPFPCQDGLEELPGKSHYFKGSDPERWVTNVSQFARVRVEEVYPGIDLEYYGNERRLEFDFAVKPGADPGRIEMVFEGVEDLSVDSEGRAVLVLPEDGTIVLERPLVFQEMGGRRALLLSRYQPRGSFRLGVALDSYDPALPLRIDPTLGYSTFLGGSGGDFANAVAVDSSGKAYIAGYTQNSGTDYPTTVGAYDTTHNSATYDACVTKLAANGASLEYSTFLGGGANDFAYGIAVDSNGKAYVTGSTTDAATDHPTTVGAYDTTQNGSTDVFVTKLAADGASLDYSTFIGGGAAEDAQGITVDSSDKAYLTGSTIDTTTDYPTSVGAYDTTHNGGSFDAFVTKLAADGASLDYSTFLGGDSIDIGYAIAVDSNGKAYATGYATDGTTEFPTTGGAYDTTHGGVYDLFITKLAANGASLDYSTFIGGDGEDMAFGIALDSNGKAHVAGYNEDATVDYPTTAGAYDTTHNGGGLLYDVVVTKLSADGASLDYSTFLGGSEDEQAYAIAVDAGGYAAVTGYTASTNYPVLNAFQGSHGGGSYDVFVTSLRPAGNQLFYSSYHGGNAVDQADGIAVDSSGNAYLAGQTGDGSTDMATTVGAYDTTQNGSTDAFVAKVSVSGTAVKLLELSAERGEDGGALVAWRTGFEVGNLGFHLWRQEGEEWVRVNPRLVPGSGLLAGERASLSGFSYSLCDAPAGPAVRYWLEELSLSGARTWHGPAAWASAPSPISASAAVRSIPPRGETPRSEVRGTTKASGALAVPGPAKALKIRVREEGWYRLEGKDLLAAGLDPGCDPRGLRLFAAGREAAIRLSGAGDGRLDPEDTVEFYGSGLESPWEDSRVYRLFLGNAPGPRVAAASLSFTRLSSPALSSFPSTLVCRERLFYFAALLNGDEENFFGGLVTGEGLDETLEARHISSAAASSAQPALEISLQGVTDARHRVAASWNGSFLGTLEVWGKEKTARSFPVLLQEGENRLSLRSEGGEDDVTALEALRLSYRRKALAEEGSLRLTAAAGTRLTVGGFRRPRIHLLDVTDPWRPRGVPVWIGTEGGEYFAASRVPGRGTRVLYAFEDDGAARRPASIEADGPPVSAPLGWKAERGGAELVIVAHPSLLEAAARLKERREEEGWSVALAVVDDLYDEFNQGQKSPAAIRELLRTGRERWQVRPRFLLLFGDATFDPRDHLGRGGADLVPTKLIDTAFLETACDDWFGDLDEDGVAEVAVGRIPARTSEEAWAAVEKLLAHKPRGAPGRVVLVAGESRGFDFPASSRALLQILPGGTAVEEIDQGQLGERAGNVLLASLAAGPFLVSYFGHGSVEQWGGGLLSSASARSLDGPPSPLYALMTCFNGFFHDVYAESLAEALLEAPGGALAVWASSGLIPPEPQEMLGRELVRLLLDGQGRTLGEAIQAAKQAVSDADVRRTFILLGDPTLRMR